MKSTSETIKMNKIDRSAFSIGELNDDDANAYWLLKTPQERIEAIAIMRQIIYGYNPATERLQRFLKLLNSKKNKYPVD